MRIYIIGNDGITLCRKAPATVNDGEIAVASNEELHAAPLSGKRLLALWNALPGVENSNDSCAVAKPNAPADQAADQGASLPCHTDRQPRHALCGIGQARGVSRSYFTRLVRLSDLAPDITKAILDGNQPPDLTADKLLAHSRLPLAWHEQHVLLGFA